METERLILRKLTADDAEKMFENWTNDEEVTKYLTWLPHKTLEVTREILEDWLEDYEDPETVRFGIELKENHDLIGEIDVVRFIDGIPVIGYASSRKYWGHGYMTEACKAMIEHLFSLGYNEIRFEADVRNIGSNRVAEKVGFKLSHQETKQCSIFKPEIVTMNWYVINK